MTVAKLPGLGGVDALYVSAGGGERFIVDGGSELHGDATTLG
jgi:hypothetical protein